MKKRLRYVAQVNPLSRRFDRLADDDLVPFLPMENVWPGDRLDLSQMRPKSAVAVGYTRFQSGDVVVPKITPTFEASRSVLIPNLPDSVGTGTTELHVVRPGSEIDPRYLLYIFHSHDFLKLGEAEMYGVAGQKRVPDDLIRDWTFDLPNLDEQCRIADFLDAETAKMDEISSVVASAMRTLSERSASGLCEAFAGDSSGVRVYQLRRVVEKWIDYRGATPTKTLSGIPLVTARNIADGAINLSASPEFVSEESYNSWMVRGLPRVGDVLLTTEAPLGQVSMITDPSVALAQRIVLLRVDRSILPPEWLYWYLQSPQGGFELASRATGSTALGIKVDRLRSVPIPVYEDAEMRKRLQVIIGFDTHVKALRHSMLQQLTLLAERRQALITAAVTGQIDITTARGADTSGLSPAGSV
ncbi:hypothetical protein [Sphaerisporangium sp. TRM90804]|uniref:restriction endonuclease subunit S n=1 Tax=Sphaerisporangium sp. TRM90804 TaxID=3031113 RepID=UPI00244C6312|nr:hypothetical protein [Sphaerisporangium sp. TRM90804]MDH2428888.1 hypothetical protein [Sphaerisporangium sp. TRM90804]